MSPLPADAAARMRMLSDVLARAESPTRQSGQAMSKPAIKPAERAAVGREQRG